jgi:hypothetical protein
MTYITLSGPASAVSPADTRYLALFNTASNSLVATIQTTPNTKTPVLALNSALTADADLVALMSLIQAFLKQNKGQTLTASDNDGVTLSMAMGAKAASTDPTLVSAWTNLNFAVEVVATTPTVTGRSNKVRFTGMNIAGIKAIASASAVTFTISAK